MIGACTMGALARKSVFAASGAEGSAVGRSPAARPPPSSVAGPYSVPFSFTRARKQAANVGQSVARQGQTTVALKTSCDEARSGKEAHREMQEQPANGDSALPWALDPESKRRPTTVQKRRAASNEELTYFSNGTTQQRSMPEVSQLDGRGVRARPTGRYSARQQLLELDREEGEDTLAWVPPTSERGRRPDKRQFQRGGVNEHKKDWRDDARLAKRAVEAILASQGLDKQASAPPAVKEDESKEGLGLAAWGGKELASSRGQVGVNGAMGHGDLPSGTELTGLKSGEVQEDGLEASRHPEDENRASLESGVSSDAAAKEKRVALARTLEALGGSLSLYRWQDVLKDLGERGHWAIALEVFKWTQENLRIKPNAFTYAQMVRSVFCLCKPRVIHFSCSRIVRKQLSIR